MSVKMFLTNLNGIFFNFPAIIMNDIQGIPLLRVQIRKIGLFGLSQRMVPSP